jgi:hypothetical protein
MRKIRVLKFDLPMDGQVTIAMPHGATVLSAQSQGGRLRLWASTDPSDAKTEDRDFYVAMTGEPINCVRVRPVFIGSVQFEEGAYVVHVFELVKE